jgi:quinol-cytochrome oxidoreductase complex cytochrome b subunit
MIGLLVIHVAFIRLHGVTELEFEDEPDEGPKHFNFFPDHVMTELAIGLVLMVVLSALATIQPAGLGPMADPLNTPEVIKPEWFFYATFRWLKLFSGTVAVLSLGFVVATMIVWPWIDAAIRRLTKWKDASFWIGVIVALSIIAMTVWEAAVEH